MSLKNLLGYRVVYEYKLDVLFKARKHLIVSHMATIEGEDDTCIKIRPDYQHSVRVLSKSDLLLASEDSLDDLGDLVRGAIAKNFDENKFSFRIFIAAKKPMKEYRIGNFIMSITKCEIQKIRDKA